jgi:hypothetical protein
MACHEIAALRLGLMRILGRRDDAERAHELAELGAAAETPGPICALATAPDLASLARDYAAALAILEERVAGAPDPYLRTLLVLTRKIDLDLAHHVDALTHLYRDLESMHDLVHELYPAED